MVEGGNTATPISFPFHPTNAEPSYASGPRDEHRKPRHALQACWRTKKRLAYPPQARVQIYDDDYAIGPKYKWRDAREGNGYYRGGVWIGF
jgi:hypothetical protein